MSKLVGTLGKIEEALASFKLPVWYGKTFCKSDDKWNYFVFNKNNLIEVGKVK